MVLVLRPFASCSRSSVDVVGLISREKVFPCEKESPIQLDLPESTLGLLVPMLPQYPDLSCALAPDFLQVLRTKLVEYVRDNARSPS